MHVDLHSAFVLHRRPYRETSLLVEAFSSTAGRVGLIARGACRARSDHAGILQPFQPLRLSWTQRGELGNLVQVEPDGPALLRGGSAMISGLYLNELLMRLLQRHDPHPEIYGAYASTLRALGGASPIEPVLRSFEACTLSALGYGLNLSHDAVTGVSIVPGTQYVYRIDQGPSVSWPDVRGDDVRVSGDALRALASATLSDPTLWPPLKRLLRAALRPHLGDRPLVSRAWHGQQGTPASEHNAGAEGSM